MGSAPITSSPLAEPLEVAPPTAMVPARADHSRFVQRIRRRYAAELALLPSGLPRRDTIVALIEHLQAGGTPGRSLGSAMRVARQLVLERLAVLDIEAGAAMSDITLSLIHI